jgi:hypothetical protein
MMPAAYEIDSKHFDQALAAACPITRAETLRDMGDRITAQALDFAHWRIRREQLDQKRSQVPAVQQQQESSASARRVVPVRRLRRAVR